MNWRSGVVTLDKQENTKNGRKTSNLKQWTEKRGCANLPKKILTWILLVLALLMGFTGYSLWRIKERIENKAESLVAKQFEEPKIQKIVQKVAAEQAAVLMSERIEPQVDKFKADVAKQLKELYSLVAEIQELKEKSQNHEQSIKAILIPLQHSHKQSQDASNQLSTVKSDIVEMQKHIATIQFYQIKGANRLPNPYQKEMMDALNKLVVIAIPNPVERNRFITELQGTQEPNK